MYPSLSYEILNIKSDFFKDFLPVINEISRIARGGHELNPNDYLMIRDLESSDITAKRLQKFTPRNHLNCAIKFQKTKQSSGDLNIDLTTLPGDPELWNKFLQDCDRRGTTYKTFILGVFENSLINQIAYVQVNSPYTGISFSDLNLAQVEEWKKRINQNPHLISLDPQMILAESEAASGSNLNWIKFKRVIAEDSPFAPTKYNLEFVLLDAENEVIWRFNDVILDKQQNILKIFDNARNDYQTFDPKVESANPIAIPHNFRCCPALKFRLPDFLWTADQCYQVQKVLFGLEMNKNHSASNCGYIQKWGKQTPSDANIPMTRGVRAEMNRGIQGNIGDESVLWLESFKFEEVQGTSIQMQMAVMEDLKQFIYSTIALNQSLIDPPKESSTPASGISKQMDHFFLQSVLQDNGSRIVNFSKDLLKAVAIAFDVRTISEEIAVSGMDKFNFQPVPEALDVVERLTSLPKGLVPPSLIQEAIQQMASALLTNHSYEQKSAIYNAINDSVSEFYNSADPQKPVENVEGYLVQSDSTDFQEIPEIDPVQIQAEHKVIDSGDSAIAIH